MRPELGWHHEAEAFVPILVKLVLAAIGMKAFFALNDVDFETLKSSLIFRGNNAGGKKKLITGRANAPP